jgi:hypothetical protein
VQSLQIRSFTTLRLLYTTNSDFLPISAGIYKEILRSFLSSMSVSCIVTLENMTMTFYVGVHAIEFGDL